MKILASVRAASAQKGNVDGEDEHALASMCNVLAVSLGETIEVPASYPQATKSAVTVVRIEGEATLRGPLRVATKRPDQILPAAFNKAPAPAPSPAPAPAPARNSSMPPPRAQPPGTPPSTPTKDTTPTPVQTPVPAATQLAPGSTTPPRRASPAPPTPQRAGSVGKLTPQPPQRRPPPGQYGRVVMDVTSVEEGANQLLLKCGEIIEIKVGTCLRQDYKPGDWCLGTQHLPGRPPATGFFAPDLVELLPDSTLVDLGPGGLVYRGQLPTPGLSPLTCSPRSG